MADVDPSKNNDLTNDPANSVQKNPFWDASMVIAIIALFISSLSAFISLKESNIMMQQQQVLAEQQEASVWPYLANRELHYFESDSVGTFTFEVMNKGVGPAIIDEVTYLYDTDTIPSWALGNYLKEKYPTLNIQQIQNATLDGSVLAPGENHIVLTERIKKNSADSLSLVDVLNEIDDLFKVQYCYCSVYGKCWRVEDWNKVGPSTNCTFREEIR